MSIELMIIIIIFMVMGGVAGIGYLIALLMCCSKREEKHAKRISEFINKYVKEVRHNPRILTLPAMSLLIYPNHNHEEWLVRLQPSRTDLERIQTEYDMDLIEVLKRFAWTGYLILDEDEREQYLKLSRPYLKATVDVEIKCYEWINHPFEYELWRKWDSLKVLDETPSLQPFIPSTIKPRPSLVWDELMR